MTQIKRAIYVFVDDKLNLDFPENSSSFTGEIIYKGNNYSFFNSVIHSSNDQPAVIRASGKKEWYQNGQVHRDNDLPAIIESNGSKGWYKEGKLHRDNDQPAVI